VQLVVGRIGRPHGVRGEVTVEVRTDSPELRFAPGTTLSTDPATARPLVVAGFHWHSGRLLLSFEGIEDRTAAEAIRNVLLVIEVDPDERPDDPDEFYDHQLIGLTVVRGAGVEEGVQLGVVSDVLHLPSQEVLSVRCPDGTEVLVPFVAEIVPEIDLAGGRVLVTPPPGLFGAAADAEIEEPDEGPDELPES
jgi:16S rRNA processing protein RimM